MEELYYSCSANKGADRLRSYCEADLRLCFCICRLLVFSCTGSYGMCQPSGVCSAFVFSCFVQYLKTWFIPVLLLLFSP